MCFELRRKILEDEPKGIPEIPRIPDHGQRDGGGCYAETKCLNRSMLRTISLNFL